MEAIIKIDNQKTFRAVVQFLQSLNFDVMIKQGEKIRQSIKRPAKRESKDISLGNLIGMYSSGISNGSVDHDKELYSE